MLYPQSSQRELFEQMLHAIFHYAMPVLLETLTQAYT